jgi:hypothetical protein
MVFNSKSNIMKYEQTQNYIIKAHDKIINKMPNYITPEQIAAHAEAEKERMDKIASILIAPAYKPKKKTS